MTRHGKFKVVRHDNSLAPTQRFENQRVAEDWARIVNERHPDAQATVIPVRASERARAHERRVVLIGFVPGVRGAEKREEAWLATAPTKAELRRERQA